MKLLFLVNTFIKSSNLLFGFIVSVLIANCFGAQTLGLYTLFITLLNLFLIFVRGGQDRLLIKELNDKSININKVLTESLCLIIILALIASLIVLLLVSFDFVVIPSDVSQSYLIAYLSLSLLAGGLITLVVVSFRATDSVSLANALEGVPINLLFLLLLSLLVFFLENFTGLDIQAYYTIVSIVVALSVFFLLKHKLSWRLDFKELDVLGRFKRGLPFLVIFGTTSLNTSIDALMINTFLPIEQLAYYNIAQKLSSLVQFGLVIGTSLIMAKMARLYYARKGDELRATLNKATSLALTIAIPVALIIYLFPQFLLSLWGDGFSSATTALFILVGAQLINVAFGPLGVMLTILNKEKQVLYWSIFTLIVNSLGNFFLVPVYGIEGAACSTACAVILENVIFYFLVKQGKIYQNSANEVEK